MKQCKLCLVIKEELDFEFYYLKNYPTLRRTICKKCRYERRKQYESRFGDGLRDRVLRKTYEITLEEYRKKSQEQDNKCGICNLSNTSGPWREKLVVDHCHKTGKLRKLLCDKCNKGLGQFNDDSELLLKASEYIKNFKDN